MKITIVFPKNGLVTARFEGEIYAYTRAYADMRTLANDYINILFNDMDGSELAGWSYNDPQVWVADMLENCKCDDEENTEDDTAGSIVSELDPAWDGRVNDLINYIYLISAYAEI